jgi:hypothetical protein
VTRRILPGKWMRRARLRTGLFGAACMETKQEMCPDQEQIGQFRIQLRASGVTVSPDPQVQCMLVGTGEYLGNALGNGTVDLIVAQSAVARPLFKDISQDGTSN